MKSFLTSHLVVTLHLLFIAVVLSGASLYISRAQAELIDSLDAHVRTKLERTVSLATLLSQNGADEIVAATITDCTDRSDFDDLLGRLDSVSKAELIRAQQLMEACGKFYPTRTALMVVRLRDALTELESALEFRARITERESDDVDIDAWRALIALEERRSAYLMEQYELQAAIITELIRAGRTDLLRTKASQAQDLNELLEVANIELRTVRAAILP